MNKRHIQKQQHIDHANKQLGVVNTKFSAMRRATENAAKAKSFFGALVKSIFGGRTVFKNHTSEIWKPKFTSSELDTIRSIKHRGDRTRMTRAIRAIHWAAHEAKHPFSGGFIGKNHLYL